MKDSKFKVGCSPLTGTIFAGMVSKNGMWGRDKHDVTATAVGAVAEHLIMRDERLEFTYKGHRYELRVDKLNSESI